MKICPTCQTQFKDGSMRFCTKDGTPLIAFVPPVIETPAPTPPIPTPKPISSPLDETLSGIPISPNQFAREPDFQQDSTIDSRADSAPAEESERLIVPVDEPQQVKAAAATATPTIIPPAASPAQPKHKSNVVMFALLGILGLVGLLGVVGAIGAYWYFLPTNKPIAVANTDDQNINAVSANDNSSDITNGTADDNTNTDHNANLNANLDNNPDANINLGGLTNLNANTRPTPTPRTTPTPKNTNRNTNQVIIIEPSEPTPTPVVRQTPTVSTPQTQQGSKTVAGGVVNGRATSLPKPPYPAAARAVRAEGQVNVQVLIDENGNVVSASAISGNPLLRQAAAAAARQAKFNPTVLSGQPVRVSGVIIYNFTMSQ